MNFEGILGLGITGWIYEVSLQLEQRSHGV